MGLVALVGMLVFVGLFIPVAAVLAVAARLVLWTVFLPFRLVFWALALPFLILKLVFLAVVGVVLFGLVGVIGGAIMVGLLAGAATLVLPLALVVLAVWGLMRLLSRPVAA